MSLLLTVIVQIAGAFIFTAITIGCALLYFQHIRMERPAIGVFNATDVGIICVFVIVLPLLYLRFSGIFLTGVLAVTFASALYIGLRPFLQPRSLWVLIALLLLSDYVSLEWLPSMRQIWQLLNNCIVFCAAISVANLYVQGGMRLKHVAYVTLFLGLYDGFTAFVTTLSAQLAERFIRQPFSPAIGLSLGSYNPNIGLGDLLVFSLFVVAAYKGFGKRGAIIASVIITCFGVLLPGLSALLIFILFHRGIGPILPVQVFFAPAGLCTYFWLSAHGTERTMAQWYAFQATRSSSAKEPTTPQAHLVREQT